MRQCNKCKNVFDDAREFSKKRKKYIYLCDDCYRYVRREEKARYEEKYPEKVKECKKRQRKRHYEKYPEKCQKKQREKYARKHPKTLPEPGHKFCSKCKMELPLDNFGKRIDRKSGYNSQCKVCVRISKGRNKYSRKQPSKDLEKQACRKHRRTAKKLGLLATFNFSQWVECQKTFDNKCAYCGREEPLTQDHFIALSKRGKYTKNNILPVCHTCNSNKRDLDFFEWYPQQKFYNKKREQKILKYLNYKNGFQ